MALKGRAKIELKNEETGDVRVIEHGNMLTNALTNALTPWLASTCYGYNTSKKAYDDTYANRLSYNTTILEHLMGGILLFADTLDEDASITEVPRGCEITGKASYDAYSGADLARGSYSTDESGYQGDLTYKHVWNFTTSQANGTIAALGLTHYLGGELGDGIEDITSEDVQTWNYKYVLNWRTGCLIAANSEDFTSSSSSSYYYYYYYMALDLANNCMYYTDHYKYLSGYSNESHFRQTGVIPLKKMRIPLTKVSPFYDYCGNYSVEDVELAIPDDFLEYAQGLTCQYYMAYSDSYCWIVPLLTSVAAGGSFKVLRVPHDDITAAETLTITNGTDYPLYIQCCARFTDDYVFGWLYKDSEYYLCRISLSDGGYALSDAPMKYISSSGESALKYSDNQYTGQSIIGKNWWYYGCGSASSKLYPVVDIDTMHVKQSYAWVTESVTAAYNDGVYPGTLRRLTGNIYAGFALGNDCMYLKIFLASDSLLTINNLDEAVVKTASQSMKITYTIQEVEETDETTDTNE